jgi:4-carboxymuconolactone decarboxylase
MNDTTGASKPPRFPQLTMADLTPEQKPLADEIMTYSSVGIGGPYNIMLRSPVFLRRMLDLLHYLRWNTSLPLHLNEFAILIVGRRWRSQVEWYAHVPIALKAGLSQAIIDQLKQKKRPEGMKDDEAIVYDFCTELAANHQVSDATFERAKRILGEQQVVDLVAVSGVYVTVAMLLSVAEAMPPEGKELPFKPGEL